MGYKVYPHTCEVLWRSSKEGHQLSNPVPLSIQFSAHSLLIDSKKAYRLRKDQAMSESGWQPSPSVIAGLQSGKNSTGMQAGWAGLKWQETWMEAGEDGPGRAHTLPGGVLPWRARHGIDKTTALVHFFCSSFSVYKWGVGNCCVIGWIMPQWLMAAPKPEGSPILGPSSSPAHLSKTPPPIIPFLPNLRLYGHSPCGVPIGWVFSHPHTGKMGLHSPSSSLDHRCQQEDLHWLQRG